MEYQIHKGNDFFPLNIFIFVFHLKCPKSVLSPDRKKVVKTLLKWKMTCNLHVKQRNLHVKQCSTSVTVYPVAWVLDK